MSSLSYVATKTQEHLRSIKRTLVMNLLFLGAFCCFFLYLSYFTDVTSRYFQLIQKKQKYQFNSNSWVNWPECYAAMWQHVYQVQGALQKIITDSFPSLFLMVFLHIRDLTFFLIVGGKIHVGSVVNCLNSEFALYFFRAKGCTF